MSDLESLRKILARQSIPWSDWPVDPEVDLDGGRAGAVHTLSLGCPDSVGAYTEFLFDRRGRLLAADTVDPGGGTCTCKFCRRKKKGRKLP